jgi:phosphomannomutase
MIPAFRSFDIRGVYPNEINETLAYKAARAIATFLKTKKIVIGRDCRISSLALKKSAEYGLLDQGINVVDIGLCNTPMGYYCAQKNDVIMITASHNPAKYNGIKITRKGVEQIGSTNGLDKIERLTEKERFSEPTKRGKLSQKNFLEEYTKYVRKLVKGKYKKLKVLIDCGNGMAGHVVPELLKGLPVKYDLLYGEMDGTYPNHTPNPAISENTKELQKRVVRGKYDLGIAYDGDCDRVFFIDEKGRRVWPEYTLLLFAKELMKKGESMSYTANSSKIISEIAKENKWKAIQCKIGHTEVPISMKKNKGVLGGELSGHFYFKKFKYADSGDIAALLMMSILSKSGKKMSQLYSPFEKYVKTEEINLEVHDRKKAMARVRKSFGKHSVKCADGFAANLGKYWFNFRISNTEPVVRLVVEANNKKDLAQGIKEVKRRI